MLSTNIEFWSSCDQFKVFFPLNYEYFSVKFKVCHHRHYVSEHVEFFLKEIRNISLVSVTAVPFSLTILQTGLNINVALLAISFSVFMLNALILNVGVWYVNNQFFRSTASQKLENAMMDLSLMDIINNSLDNAKRVDSLMIFFQSQSKLTSKKQIEPYKHINLVDKIRFVGIALLSSAILFLITSIVLPVFKITF